jgi:hypothetical protein
MGMGAMPQSGYLISAENLQKISPAVAAAYTKLIETLKIRKFKVGDDDNYGNFEPEIDALAYCIEHEEHVDEDIVSDLLDLQNQFEKDTEVDGAALHLSLMYYSRENGDRYDELNDGANWFVDRVEVKSAPGKKFEDLLEHRQWVIYG